MVWTGTGRLVGSLGEFEKECMDKYDVRVGALPPTPALGSLPQFSLGSPPTPPTHLHRRKCSPAPLPHAPSPLLAPPLPRRLGPHA